MSTVVIKCPFGHDCVYDPLIDAFVCTKCEQYLNYENYEKWMNGDIRLMDQLIWIKVPKLVFGNNTEVK